MRRQSCADDENDPIHTGEEASEMAFRGRRAPDDDLALFLLRVFNVVAKDGVFIRKNGLGFFETHAVFFFRYGLLFLLPS